MGVHFDKDFYAGQFTKHVRPINFELTRELALYFKTIFDKSSKVYLGVLVRDFEKAFNNTQIELPITESGEIDFSDMTARIRELEAARIRELEAARIRELEAYMQVTGLMDYHLNSEDESILARNVGGGTYQKFKITDVFAVKNTHSILSSLVIPDSGNVPYVTASEANNSVNCYVNYDNSQIEKGNSIMIGGKTLVVTYQADDYFSNDSHNLALYPLDLGATSREVQLYLVGALYKSLKPKYTWGNSISYKKIQKDSVMLPTQKNGKPDYEYMKLYVRIQQKLAIQNIVTWRDQYITATKIAVA